MPPLVGAAVSAGISAGFAAAGGGILGLTAIKSAIVVFTVNFSLAAVSIRLARPDEPAFSQGQSGQTLTVKQPITTRKIINGYARVGGPLFLLETTDNTRFLHLCLALGGHELAAIGTVYLNDEPVRDDQLDTQGNVVDGKFAGKVRIRKHLGAPDQIADPLLIAEVPDLDESFRGREVPYLYVRLEFDRDLFPTRIPNVSAEVLGRKVFDPRTGATVWTDNAALLQRDYLADARYGRGAQPSELDEDQNQAIANLSDEMIPLAVRQAPCTVANNEVTISGADARALIGQKVRLTGSDTIGFVSRFVQSGLAGSDQVFTLASTLGGARLGEKLTLPDSGGGVEFLAEPRYTINGVVDSATAPSSIIRELAGASAGSIVRSGGLWKISPASWNPPVVELDENDIIEPLQVQTRISRRSRLNGIKGTYVSPWNNDQPSDYPAVKSVAFADEDGGERLADVQRPLTNSPSMAQRLGRIEVLRARQEITVKGVFKLSALRAISGGTVTLSNKRLGWVSKPFEVVKWTFSVKVVGGAPAMIVALDLRETAADVFDWTTSLETQIDPAPNTNLPSAFVSFPPNNVVADSGNDVLQVAGDGTIVSNIRMSWESPIGSFADGYQIAWRDNATPEAPFSETSVPRGATSYLIPGVVDGRTYTIDVRAVNGLGVRSSPAMIVHQVLGKSAPPPDLGTFTVARQADGTREFRWSLTNPPADVLIGGNVRIKFKLGPTNDWDSMDLLQDVPFTPGLWESNQLAAGAYTFAAKIIDSSGNESPAGVFINAILGDPRLREVLVQRQEQNLGWPGTRTDCFVTPENALEATAQVGFGWDNLGTWDSLGTWKSIHPKRSPIVYETEVIDLGLDLTFTPQITVQTDGAITITMRTHTDAEGADLSLEPYVPLEQASARYVQIRVEVADAEPVISGMTVLLDGESLAEEFQDVNTLTESGVWFNRIAAGHFRIGGRRDFAALTQAQITALQNVGPGFSWELVSKSVLVNGKPAAEFRIYDGSGVLTDSTIDVLLRGPRAPQ